AAEAVKGMAAVQQFLDLTAVQLTTLALAVGTMWTTNVGAFTPAQTQPVQGIEDILLGLRGAARLVSVLNPQNEVTAVLMGKAAVEQGDIGRANVGITGGRWCDACSYLLHGLPADDVITG